MVKLKTGQITSFMKAPPETCLVAVVYGPDTGLVHARAMTLCQSVIPDLADPFRVTRLTGKMITEDPARLFDDVFALSMIGGRRLVYVRDATEGVTRPLADVLAADISGLDVFVVMEAGDLPPRSGLRKLAEQSDAAAAVPCYVDDARTLQAVIVETLRQAGYDPDQDALQYLQTVLGGDRQVTLRELEKISLYLSDPSSLKSGRQSVTVDDLRPIVSDSADITGTHIVQATALGQVQNMERALDRAILSGLTPVYIIRAHMTHFQRLHLTAGCLSAGMSVTEAMNTLTPRVFFKDQPAFQSQLNMWSLTKLNRALDLLVQAEIDCKSTGVPEISVCQRVLLSLARAAVR